jgi:hypothetical protein
MTDNTIKKNINNPIDPLELIPAVEIPVQNQEDPYQIAIMREIEELFVHTAQCDVRALYTLATHPNVGQDMKVRLLKHAARMRHPEAQRDLMWLEILMNHPDNKPVIFKQNSMLMRNH